MFATILFSSLVAIIIFGSIEYNAYFHSMSYSSLQMSNFYFEKHTGYSDLSSKNTPLLHTWSLAVEEQFYLFWPLALWLVARLKCSRIVTLLVIIICSFVTMFYFQQTGSSKDFYMFYSHWV